jgi:hypothetical protein
MEIGNLVMVIPPMAKFWKYLESIPFYYNKNYLWFLLFFVKQS